METFGTRWVINVGDKSAHHQAHGDQCVRQIKYDLTTGF